MSNLHISKKARLKHRSPAGKNRRGLILWLVPAGLFYAFVTVVPSFRGLVYAFTDWNGLSASFNFIGFENFVSVFQDPMTLAATLQTLFYAIVVTIAETAVGLGLALGLTTSIRSRNLLRVVLFMPFVITPIVVAFLWKYIYTPSGPLDQVVSALGLTPPGWLGDPEVAKWSVSLAIIWQLLGLAIVIFIAAISTLPEEIVEAAHLDGANAFHRFWFVTLPMLRPAMTIVIVLTMLTCIKLFDQVWVLTQGGPSNSTQSLTTALYQKAFTFGNFGDASVLAIIITVLGSIAALVQFRLQRRRGVRS